MTEAAGAAYEPQAPKQVTVAAGQTVEADFNNTLKYGRIVAVKSSEDGAVEGVKFNLSGTSLSGQAVDITKTTGADGRAVFNKVPVSGDKPYILREVGAADRYVVVPGSQDISVEWNKETLCYFTNKLKPGRLEVIKTSEDGVVEGVDNVQPGNDVLTKGKVPKTWKELMDSDMIDYSDIKAMTAELQKIGTNINQIAKRVNATGTVYAQDIEDIKWALYEIWQSQRSILSKAP